MFDDDEPEFDEDGHDKKSRVSVLDKDPKTWSANEALQAKTIYAALKGKHELEVQQGLFYEKKKLTLSLIDCLQYLREVFFQFQQEQSRKFLNLQKSNSI